MQATKLEKLIINLAEHCVRQIKAYSGKGLTDQDEFDINASFIEGNSLIQLALISDNGMTPDASAQLKKIERELAQAMSSVRVQQQSYTSLLSEATPSPTRH